MRKRKRPTEKSAADLRTRGCIPPLSQRWEERWRPIVRGTAQEKRVERSTVVEKKAREAWEKRSRAREAEGPSQESAGESL